jgi:integrase
MKGCQPLSPKQYRIALRRLKGRYRWRDRALLTLGVRTGMRISELLSIRIGQIYDGSAIRPRVYLDRQDSKGKRTGSSIIIHPKAEVALAKWIHSRGAVSPDDWLFPSQRCSRRPLGRRAAWLILHKGFLAAGVSGMAGTHCMRKSFCNNVYRVMNGDLFRLAKAMRHSSPLSTLAYLSFRQEEIDRAILRA